MSEFIEVILKKISNIVIMIDHEGNVTYISPSVSKVLGYRPQELLGYGWWQMTRDNVRLRNLERNIIKEMIAGRIPVNDSPYESLLRSADGSYRWILWSTSKGPGNTLIGVGTDITLKKRREARLKKSKQILIKKNMAIADSIRYASYIQRAVLPDMKMMKARFKDLFVFYRPKDIVSGDFYWYHKEGAHIFIAAADCTGHGVPGAMLSVLGNTLLKHIVMKRSINDPAEILKALDAEIIFSLNNSNSMRPISDGMDIALLHFDMNRNVLQFAGAYRPLIRIRNNELKEYPGDRYPIGFYMGIKKHFSQVELPLKEGDLFFIFSDGYTDQFGGENVKKFNRLRFRNLLYSIRDMRSDKQEAELRMAFDRWKGNSEQIDDVCVIGVRI